MKTYKMDVYLIADDATKAELYDLKTGLLLYTATRSGPPARARDACANGYGASLEDVEVHYCLE